MDSEHELVREFNATVTPESVVIAYDVNRNPRVIYQGLINNLFDSIGNRRDEATEHYVREAIIAWDNNKSVSPNYRSPKGCMIEQMK